MAKKLEVEVSWRATIVPGTYAAEATIPSFACPIGCVYWRYGEGNDTIEILTSFTINSLRRKGIRTQIHDAMVEFLGRTRFVTTTGNKRSTPWLIKMGFKKNERGVWVLKIKEKLKS